MPTIAVDYPDCPAVASEADRVVTPDEVAAEFAREGVEMVSPDGTAADGAEGDGAEVDDDPDSALGTAADPDFVEHGEHVDERLEQIANGEVDDDCPYCPTAAELNDHGDQGDAAHDDGADDGDG